MSSRIENYRKRIADNKAKSFHVKKGDKVLVICGDDRGKSGVILEVIKKKMRVIVAGINMHQDTSVSSDGTKQRVSVELPIHVSNVKKLS